ncbi:MAG: hypothetical protein ACLGIP_16730 [Alphaproteobacteria bacterium]
MKHDRISWTVQALANRADQIEHVGTMADITGGDEDYREVAVYYSHELADFIDERMTCFIAGAAEVIGVVIGGDDPSFPAEVLDRSQAQDRLGSEWVARWEEIQTEKLQ